MHYRELYVESGHNSKKFSMESYRRCYKIRQTNGKVYGRRKLPLSRVQLGLSSHCRLFHMKFRW